MGLQKRGCSPLRQLPLYRFAFLCYCLHSNFLVVFSKPNVLYELSTSTMIVTVLHVPVQVSIFSRLCLLLRDGSELDILLFIQEV